MMANLGCFCTAKSRHKVKMDARFGFLAPKNIQNDHKYVSFLSTYYSRNSVICCKNDQIKVKKAKSKCALRQSKDLSANDFFDEFFSFITRSNDLGG